MRTSIYPEETSKAAYGLNYDTAVDGWVTETGRKFSEMTFKVPFCSDDTSCNLGDFGTKNLYEWPTS